MGITLCPKHGESGNAHVCSHIHSAVKAYSPVTEFEVWKFYIDFIDGDIEMPSWLCPQCFEALRSRGLPDTGFYCESEEDEAMLERVFEQDGEINSGVCGSCLDECIAMGRSGSGYSE